jgi:hypothetical protein
VGDYQTQRTAPVIGWKSPITGAVNVSFSLTDLDGGGYTDDNTTAQFYGVEYYLWNGNTSITSGYMPNGQTTGTLTASNLSVSAGGMIYLMVSPYIHNWSADTAVTFTVTQTPEPAAMTLLAAGAIAMLLYAWQKRR